MIRILPGSPHDGQHQTPSAPPCPPPPLKACTISHEETNKQEANKKQTRSKQANKQIKTDKQTYTNTAHQEKNLTQAPVQPC